MNRAERRSYMKQGATKETVDQLNRFNSPCNIAEAVQIARASAEDVVEDYHKQNAPIQIAISMQLEILKSMLFEAGVISEEEFRTRYVAQAEEFNQMMDTKSVVQDAPKMEVKANDIDVRIEE